MVLLARLRERIAGEVSAHASIDDAPCSVVRVGALVAEDAESGKAVWHMQEETWILPMGDILCPVTWSAHEGTISALIPSSFRGRCA